MNRERLEKINHVISLLLALPSCDAESVEAKLYQSQLDDLMGECRSEYEQSKYEFHPTHGWQS